MNSIHKKKNTCKIILLFIISTLISYGQNTSISGKVKDSGKTLPNANILAIPQQENAKVTFAITKEDGSYSLTLQQNIMYKVTVSYLGYEPQTIVINPTTETLTKDFILKPATNQLDEVVINYKIPLVVKKDTLLYNVSSFTDGNERKLREVLKKLPGVEVDREGNVTVQGKKVTKVLVEDKAFFTGDSKLAVNNIPADAVDKVEVLDNYSEVPFLKGLQDSDEMAMNIKLKEEKKKFAFGDVEVGGGPEERYIVHPTLFYYSPKTNVNLIADLNNIGVKSFTFKDYIDFEGGFTKLLEDSGAYFNLYTDDFANYLNNRDFKENINRFGAFNIRQSLNKHTDINAYVISTSNQTDTETINLNQYLSGETFTEQRVNTNSIKNNFTLGKMTLDYQPAFDEDLQATTSVKVSNSNANGLITTASPFVNNQIETNSQLEAYTLTQSVAYSRKLSSEHTGTFNTNVKVSNETPQTNWLTNQPILQGLIPLENDIAFNIFQEKETKNFSFDGVLKDYWVLNNTNHIYTSVGARLFINEFFSSERQLLSTGAVNDFSDNDFGNMLTYRFNDVFTGIEYKFQKGKFIFKPALFYHFYNWQLNQLESNEYFYKGLLLPQFTTNVELKNSEKINFRYSVDARFPVVNQLAANFILQNFNSVYRGNPSLENTLNHTINLSYYKFSLYKNLLLNAGINYNRRIKNPKNETQLQGIDQFSTTVLLENPESSLNANFQIRKKINTLRYNIKANAGYNEFFQLVNGTVNKNISKQLSGAVGITTFFNKKWPVFDIGYTKELSDYTSLATTQTFENSEVSIEIEYAFFKDFLLKFDYRRSNYTNKDANINNTFDVANASLFYQKEDSPWGFEILATNLFNISFKQQNSFSDFLISDQQIFILPRVLLFKVVYKL